MAARRPLALVSGRVKELPTGDSIKGSTPWTLLNSWDFTVSGGITELIANITGYAETLVAFQGVTLSGSDWRYAGLSCDGGSTYLTCNDISSAGIESAANANGAIIHSTSSASARGGFVCMSLPSGVGYASVVAPARTIPAQYFLTTAAPTHVRAYANGKTMNGGHIFIYGR